MKPSKTLVAVMQVIKELRKKFLNSLFPPPELSLSDWADENAYLSPESSADPGKWHTIKYQKGIMDAITDPSIEQVWVMKSARVGFTKILNNVIGYHIAQDPCSIMVVQPTIEDAQGYSKEEIQPMLRDTPVLRGLVSDAKNRDGDNTILGKNFPGGTLGLIGANSPRGFRRVSRRVVLFDEIDGYPVEGAGDDGDQIKLGIKRSDYFWNRKIVGGSTPLIKDISRIEKLFKLGDQRRFFVPCPHCGEYQYLKWKNIKWPEGKPEEAFYVCEINGCVIEHSDKREMVERGEFRATAVGASRVASFHIWAAYSLSPNASWGQLAKEFIEAASDPLLLKAFVNTVLGETWDDDYSGKVGANELAERADDYEQGFAPAGVLVAVAAVDVQDNRFEISRWGYGKGEESWLISHDVIEGDPARPEIWKQLDILLSEEIKHEVAPVLKLAAVAIDSGGSFTHEVYQYCRERKAKMFIAVKGMSQRGKPAINVPTKVDINSKGLKMKKGGLMYPVGSDTVKDIIYGRLKSSEPGPGCIHFCANMPNSYYEQLTSEKKKTRKIKGVPVKEWVLPKGNRNEALDCAVYSYCALQFLMTKYHRDTFWKQMEEKLFSKQSKANKNKGSGNSGGKESGRNFVNSW